MEAPSFVIHSYTDGMYAARLISQIRSHYPTAAIALIGDGVNDVAAMLLQSIAKGDRHIELTLGDRLKPWENRAAWTIRWMAIVTNLPSKTVIKMDSDAVLERAWGYIPDADIAGHLAWNKAKGITIVRGGCVAYGQGAIAKILRSGQLEKEGRWDQWRHSYRRWQHFRLPNDPALSDELLWLEDVAIADLIAELGLTVEHWYENYIAFRGELPSNHNLRWAARHPVR